MGSLKTFASTADHSWIRELVVDPEAEAQKPNKRSRQVRSGHWVPVKPTPLPRPHLLTFSPAMAAELGLSKEACESEDFAKFFSGDIDVMPAFESWATPYALSINGKEMYENCPFGNGNGYGDGRAVSIGEVVVNGKRWELQLKGGGTTPFCRGADGRAVLRSSVREFLASEAMNAMGVETTRALSLVVSGEETTNRPWYDSDKEMPKVDEALLMKVAPHLAGESPEVKRMLMQQLKSQVRNPNLMQTEKCAITTRVAPSFTRVGHIELHGRRARTGGEQELEHLRRIVQHAIQREYADVDDPTAPIQARTLIMVHEFAKRLSKLVADWLRVGYCQGNFNSDNCLVSGRTMDYGPFGFIEKYEPLWNMWVGGGEHYAFMNQPRAAHRNFYSFVKAVSPLLEGEAVKEAQAAVDNFEATCRDACVEMWQRKMGLQSWGKGGAELFNQMEDLLSESSMDYTIFWRQLAEFPAKGCTSDTPAADLLAILKPACYEELKPDLEGRWVKWLGSWLARLKEEGVPGEEVSAAMKLASPKYVPREWMLVAAYDAANAGDYSLVEELATLLSKPFDEQPMFEQKYYCRAPAGSDEKGGTAFMS